MIELRGRDKHSTAPTLQGLHRLSFPKHRWKDFSVTDAWGSHTHSPNEDGDYWTIIITHTLTHTHTSSLNTHTQTHTKYSPHDNGDQPHDGLIETVEELPEGLALLLHVADDEAKAHGEDHQPQGIDPVHRARDRDHLLPGNLLSQVGQVEDRVVHCHRYMDNSLPVFGFELEGKSRLRE